MISIQDIIIRLLVAALASGLVGLQRSLSGKVAGMRTHMLIGMGAAIFTLVSAYGFGTAHATQDRIAAQVVSGLGFIAGGVILKERGTIKGITTAAGLWAVASLGMAAGAGWYALAFLGTGLVLATLVGMRLVEVHFPRRRLATWEVTVRAHRCVTCAPVEQLLAPRCHRVWLVSLSQSDETAITLGVEVPHTFDIDGVTAALRGDGFESVQWTSVGGLEE